MLFQLRGFDLVVLENDALGEGFHGEDPAWVILLGDQEDLAETTSADDLLELEVIESSLVSLRGDERLGGLSVVL